MGEGSSERREWNIFTQLKMSSVLLGGNEHPSSQIQEGWKSHAIETHNSICFLKVQCVIFWGSIDRNAFNMYLNYILKLYNFYIQYILITLEQKNRI